MIAKISALRGCILPDGIGLQLVRSILASISRSYRQLIAFAEAAAIAPPKTVINIKNASTCPSEAIHIAPAVVISNKTIMRGLVSSV